MTGRGSQLRAHQIGKCFRGKWGLGAPPPPPPPTPRPRPGAVGVLLKIPGGGVFQERGGGEGGGRARGVCGEFGGGGGGRGRRGPIYRENEPLFRRKRLNSELFGSGPIPTTLIFLSLLFWNSPCFFPLQGIPCFFQRFPPFFPRDFGGSLG